MQAVSATIDGEVYNIFDVQQNGTDVYIRMIDSQGVLKLKKYFRNDANDYTIIATSAVIV